MNYDESIYRGLVEFSKQNNDALKSLNLQTINLMQSNEMVQMLKTLSFSINEIVPRINSSVLNFAVALNNISPAYNSISKQLSQPLQVLAKRYVELLGSYNATVLKDSARLAFQNSQMSTIAQLCLSHKTPMIQDVIGCLVNAKYEYLPDVLNKAMTHPIIGAADVAFIKTGTIIPILESELVYPRGFKSSLKALNKSTALDIADNADIKFDTKSNAFIGSDSEIDSKGMNIVCSGMDVFDSSDLFTEVELMDFISLLSRTPMVGGYNDTGKKIIEWLQELYNQKTNMMSFDRKIYYHCRSRQKDEMPYTFDEMMKAPYGLPGAGRYNQVGRSHFYFASTQNGAEVEVKKHLKKDQVTQTVMIKPIKEIKLLDLSKSLKRGAAFLKMIRYPLRDEKNQMPKEYLLPCFVADCCKQIGFEGIKYYGSKEYDNYVSWNDGYFEDGGMCVL